MANAAELILRTLDRHLTGPAEIRLMGGAALILAYGIDRTTEDADLLQDDRECELLVERAGFGDALEATNRELEPLGLYVSHIWGPEQQILTPAWRDRCRPVDLQLPNLRATALGPLDLIVSKLCRADDEDLADIRFLVEHERLDAEEVRRAMREAMVPEVFRDGYPEACARAETILREER